MPEDKVSPKNKPPSGGPVLQNAEFDLEDLNRTISLPLKQRRNQKSRGPRPPIQQQPKPVVAAVAARSETATSLPSAVPSSAPAVEPQQPEPISVAEPIAPLVVALEPPPTAETIAAASPSPVVDEPSSESVNEPVETPVEAAKPEITEIANPALEPAPAAAKSSTQELPERRKTVLKIEEQPGLAAVLAEPQVEPEAEPVEEEKPVLYYTNSPRRDRTKVTQELPEVRAPVTSTTSIAEATVESSAAAPVGTSIAEEPEAATTLATPPVAAPEPIPPVAEKPVEPQRAIQPSPQPEPASMKSSSPYTSRPGTSPAKTNSAAGGSSPRNPVGFSDYKGNVERQAKEQKSFGSVLSIVVYVLLAFVVTTAGLAGYGLYILKEQVSGQASTIHQLQDDEKVTTDALASRIGTLEQQLKDSQAQVDRQNEVLQQQEQKVNQILSDLHTEAALLVTATTSIGNAGAAIAHEKNLRQNEVDDIREHIRHLDSRLSDVRNDVTKLQNP